MIYAEVDSEGSVIRYPANPRGEHPQTAMRSDWPGGEIMAADGTSRWYESVSTAQPPEYDPNLARVTEGTPARVGGELRQSWILHDLTQAEIDDRLAERRRNMICTRFQAFAALHEAGLMPGVESALGDQSAPAIWRIAFDHMQMFHRANSVTIAILSALGLDDAQQDALFEHAMMIEI